ncbi:hypothetical protein PsorP6_002233 [Peronosclerospora sorghi]|uniref:Uncharacterized protein n=1 Tax=Peronosclerospora sorghi TaxID=230839 RepID=A0ACC0WRH4_9STRA|nr:hypothetical protein PsorP6_002233 [Peronosclerospora sorghi]
MLQTKPQSSFAGPPHIVAGSGSDWESARRDLRRVNEYALPLDRLKRFAQPLMTTDEFISVHWFLLAMSNMSQLLVTCELLRMMCYPHDITEEMRYYLTT